MRLRANKWERECRRQTSNVACNDASFETATQSGPPPLHPNRKSEKNICAHIFKNFLRPSRLPTFRGPPFFVRPFEPTQLQQEKLFFASNFASNKMWVNGSISHDLNVAKKFKLVECKNIGLFCPKVCWILLPSHGVTSVWRNGCRVMNKLSHRGSRCRFRNQRCCQFWQISIVVGGGVVVTSTK